MNVYHFITQYNHLSQLSITKTQRPPRKIKNETFAFLATLPEIIHLLKANLWQV